MSAIGQLNLGCELAHDLRRGGNFADRFFLDAQTHRQRRNLHRRQLAAHQPPPK